MANKASVPTNAAQTREFGLDLGASKTNMPDGTTDNQLGNVFAALGGQGLDVQSAIDLAVADGSIILLFDFQTADLAAAGDAGFQVKLGANPNPAPCTNPADPLTCGQHLKGTGTFEIAANSPTNAAVNGQILGGVFTGGPGEFSLQIALGGPPVTLSLKGARAKATGITDAGIESVILAGMLTKTDLDAQVLPAIHGQIGPLVTRDCPGAVLPACACTGNTGKAILALLDTAPKDCMVSLDEVKGNAVLKSLLSADVCTTASCAAPDALSIGIKVTATKATFPTAP